MHTAARILGAAVLLFAALAGCNANAGSEDTRQGPAALDENAGSRSADGTVFGYDQADQRPVAEAAQPRAPMKRGEELIRVLTANIDLDAADEQVLVFRDAAYTELPIKLGVIDFDSVRRTYFRTWEGETGATNARTLELSLQDVVGDRSIEIVARGSSGRGEQTLDIFRKTPSATRIGINFSSILSIVVAGVIEIEAAERPESYVVGQRNGPAFPVVTYVSDPQALNLTDLVKTSYFWEYPSGHYVGTTPELLLGEEVEDAQLRALYTSREPLDFEEFISGPWYRVLQARPGTPLDRRLEIVHFGVADRRVNIFRGDVQEIYVWELSRRTLCCSLQIRAHNESIPSIEKKITVSLRSMREVLVSVQGVERSDRTEATYARLSGELQKQLLEGDVVTTGPADLTLTGLYRDADGETILFEAPSFTWISDVGTESGGFAVHSFGGPVLVFRVLSRSGLTLSHRSFALRYEEQQSGERLVRSILLQPATLTVDGAVAQSAPALRFEQVEFLTQGEVSASASGDIIITAPNDQTTAPPE